MRLALRQVGELGIDLKSFRRRARREGWIEHGDRLWSPPGTELDDWGRASRAVLACGPHAAVTGLAALRLHGLDVLFPTPIRVVTPMNRHVTRTVDDEIKVIASRTLCPSDITSLRRVPMADVDRSFVDLVVPPTPAITPVRDTFITALQARKTTQASARARIERARGVPGRGVLLRAIDDLDATGTDSPFSHRVHARLLRDGFRPDDHPVEVPTPARRLHPDITFSHACVCIECDGFRWHSRQRDIAIDDRKDRAYRRATWICFRIGWWEFDHGWMTFTNDLRDALAGR